MTRTRRRFTLFALIIAACVGAGGATLIGGRSVSRLQADAAARVDAAFNIVAAMPAKSPFLMPVAQKGDLLVPPECAAMVGDAHAECMDVAYEIDSAPSLVVESRRDNTSTLLKLDPMAVADINRQIPQQAE